MFPQIIGEGDVQHTLRNTTVQHTTYFALQNNFLCKKQFGFQGSN